MEPFGIRTDELVLRAWRPADAPALRRARQAPELAALTHLDDLAARSFVPDAGTVAVAVCDGDTLVGGVDLHHVDPRGRTAELGYWSAPWARGRRVTERAARALLRWGFDHHGLVRVDWRATIGNHASRLTGLRLGFRMIGLRPGPYERPDEWLAVLGPDDLTGPGFEPAPAVRRQALTFGGAMPRLESYPVRLRPLAARDAPALVAAYQDPEIIRWYGVPVPYTEDHARRLIERVAPDEFARGVETVLAVTGPDDAWAGTIDLRVGPDDPQVGEVGFLIAPAHRGRGYATTAVRTLTDWGFDALGLARVQWRAEVGNEPSRRVAQKAGFTMEGLLRQSLEDDGRRYDCWVGSRLRDG